MKNKILLWAMLTLIALAPNFSKAESQNDRTGYSYSVGLPIGFSDHMDQDDTAYVATGLFLKVNYGFSQRIQIFGELGGTSSLPFNNYDSEATLLMNASFGGKFFIDADYDIYVTTKIGLGFGEVFNEDLPNRNDREGFGLNLGVSMGNEWALSDKMALGAELKFDFYGFPSTANRNSIGSGYFIGPAITFTWY